MSALSDRITEVVARHDDWWPDEHQTDWECCCGWKGKCHAAHVAERIEAELQLTEETERMSLLDMPFTRRRWVSAWSEVSS